MHFNRDTTRLLNESIGDILNPQYLSEQEFSYAYDQYLEFISENFTEDEIDSFTEEELVEGFMSRLGGFLGRSKKALSDAGSDFKKGYEEGRAGERNFLGKKKEEPKPEAKEEPKPEEKEEPKPEEKEEPKPKKKLTPEQKKKIEVAKPEAIRKAAQREAAASGPKDELTMSLVDRLKKKGLLTSASSVDKTKISAVKDRNERANAKLEAAKDSAKEEKVNKKRKAALAKCKEKAKGLKGKARAEKIKKCEKIRK